MVYLIALLVIAAILAAPFIIKSLFDRVQQPVHERLDRFDRADRIIDPDMRAPAMGTLRDQVTAERLSR